MAVYTWEGGWAVHGRGGEQVTQGDKTEKGAASQALGEAARYTDRQNTLVLSRQHNTQDTRQAEPQPPKTNTTR